MAKFHKIFVVFLIISTLVSCENVISPPVIRQKITLGIGQQPTSILMFVAMEQKLFEKYGLEVEIKKYPSGKRAVEEGLFENQADIISSAEVPIAFAAEKHPELRIITSITSANDVNSICARRDLGIQRAKDLMGKNIAVQFYSSTHYFLHQFLIEQGITQNNVNVVNLKTEELVPALVDGKVSAISVREPHISQCQSVLRERSIVFTGNRLYEQHELLVTTQAFSDLHPDVIRALIQTLLDAEQYAKAHPREVIAMTAKHLGIAYELVATMSEQFFIRLELSQSLLLLLEDEFRWGREMNVLEGKMPNFTAMFLLQPLSSLTPERVTIIP